MKSKHQMVVGSTGRNQPDNKFGSCGISFAGGGCTVQIPASGWETCYWIFKLFWSRYLDKNHFMSSFNFLRSGCTCFSISLPFEKLFPPLLGKKQRIYGRTLSDSPTDLKVLETDLNDMEAGELTNWKRSSRSFLNWLPHVLTSKYSCFSPSRWSQ